MIRFLISVASTVRSRLNLAPIGRPLGKGWQHRAYDLENGRVFKELRRYLPLLASVLRAPASQRPLRSRNILRETGHLRKNARTALQKLASRKGQFPPVILANPSIFSDGSYEQDKAIVFADYLRTHSLEQNKRAIDKYVQLQHNCWEWGFGDPGFDFAVNNGLDENGEVVQIDLGELVFSYDKLIEAVRNRNWEFQNSYVRLEDEELREYFSEQMDAYMTVHALATHWEQRITQINAPKGSDDYAESFSPPVWIHDATVSAHGGLTVAA